MTHTDCLLEIVKKAAAADYPIICNCTESKSWAVACNSEFMTPAVTAVLTANASEVDSEQFNGNAAADDFFNKKVTVLKFKREDISAEQITEIVLGGGDDFFCTYGGFSFKEANLLNAAAEFVHSQLSFVDRNAYTLGEIRRFMGLYPEVLRQIMAVFAAGGKDYSEIFSVVSALNSGIAEKDVKVRTVLAAAAEFFRCIMRSNTADENKTALAFRLDPAFMSFFEKVSPSYAAAFPPERPFGVFFFYRGMVSGFQIRFAPIARGGWRTVIPKPGTSPLDMRDAFEYAHCELFRECFVLANTQHKKNKDIYEGGSKMVTLLENLDGREFKTALWSAQRAVFEAFLSLLQQDKNDIVEIGPDENMFDDMITYMGDRAEAENYALKSGIISGKVDSGINHKHYGVTSFGVFQYLMTTLRYFNIEPEKDEFSVILSGGPFGDVAGNMMKLLNQRKSDGTYLIPNVRFTAVTDGPAAVYDPAGIDREELSRLIHTAALDGFDPAKLSGEGAFMLWSTADADGKHRMDIVKNGKVVIEKVSRDDYMRMFQNNIFRSATVFVPCGGRPQTVHDGNFSNFLADGRPLVKAIVEGANSFITPSARLKLQDAGIVIVKDSSANKCGVITSSYEILSGILLEKDEFSSRKEEVVKEIMDKLASCANKEAAWLFKEFSARKNVPMTKLSDELADRINDLKASLFDLFGAKGELLDKKLVLAHLPSLYRQEFADRISRIPAPYLKAIAAAEVAGRMVFNPDDAEIKAVADAL